MYVLGHPEKVIPFLDRLLYYLLAPAAPPEPGLSGGKAQGQSVLDAQAGEEKKVSEEILFTSRAKS